MITKSAGADSKHTDFMPGLYESPRTTPVHTKWGLKALAIAFAVKAFIFLLGIALIIVVLAVLMTVFRTR